MIVVRSVLLLQDRLILIMEVDQILPFEPTCIASTGKTFCKSIAACHPEGKDDNGGTHRYRVDDESNCFRSAQLSADGSTVVTYSEDLVYRSFIL